jgi:hypothetical protein
MTDSTCTLIAPPAPPRPPATSSAGTAQPEPEGNEGIRTDLARFAEMETPGVVTRLLHGDPWDVGPRANDLHPALAQLVHEAMPVLGRLCREGRLVSRDEVIPFRFLATRCAHAGINQDVAASIVSNAAEAVMDAVIRRTRELDELYGAANVEAATAMLCGVLEDFAGRVAAQLGDGYKAYAASLDAVNSRDPERATRLLRRMAHTATNDDAARAILVVVATGQREDAEALAAAAREIQVHVPGAIEAGAGADNVPSHHRVVVPVADGDGWRTIYPVLRYVAITYGVVIVTRPPVRSLAALRDCYYDVCSSLREVMRTSGQRSGVVGATADTPVPDAPLPAAA